MEHAIRELAVEAGSGYNNTTYDACAKGDDEDSGMNISVMLGVLIAFVASSARAPLPRRACHAAPHQQPPCPPSAPAVGINIGNNMQALGLKMGTAVGKEKKEYEDSLRSNESDASSAAAAEAAELAAQAHAAKLKAQASLKRLDMASGTSGTRQAPPDAPPSPPPSPSSGDANAAIESHDYNAPENQPRVSREKSEALDATAVAITNPPHAVPELHTRDSKAGDVMFSAPADFTARMKKAKVLYGVGTVVFFGSTLTVFGAMALAPASILAPIEAVQFPTNVAFARIVNKVAVNAKMVLSSLTILVGLAVIVASGNHANTSYTPADLAEKWENGTWIGYLSGVVLVAAVCHVVWLVYEKARKAERPMPSSDTVLPSLYALSSSMIGSISVLQVPPPLPSAAHALHLPAGGCSCPSSAPLLRAAGQVHLGAARVAHRRHQHLGRGDDVDRHRALPRDRRLLALPAQLGARAVRPALHHPRHPGRLHLLGDAQRRRLLQGLQLLRRVAVCVLCTRVRDHVRRPVRAIGRVGRARENEPSSGRRAACRGARMRPGRSRMGEMLFLG